MASSIIPMPRDVHSLGTSTAADTSADFYIPYSYRGIIFCVSANASKVGMFFASANSQSQSSTSGKVNVVPIYQGADISFDTTVANQITFTFSDVGGSAVTSVYSLDFAYANMSAAGGIAPHKIEAG